MPNTDSFHATPPLDYYYKDGYQVMNPFCRIISEAPQYRYALEYRDGPYTGDKSNPWTVLADSVTARILIALKGNLRDGQWRMLGISDEQHRTVISGDAEAEYAEYAANMRKEGISLSGFSETDLRDGNKKYARERLAALLKFLDEAKNALASRKHPEVSWVIRGDGPGMIDYMKTRGVDIPDVGTPARVCRSNVKWNTNQFFSTSDRNELASLAGKDLVWLIRIKPETTKGRSGGMYTGENEVLFPYDVSFTIDGCVSVSSIEQISGVDLTGFSDPGGLRKKLCQVYAANRRRWTHGVVRFLLATEE
ncbi:hypothetical protein [Massilia aurea]|uniref:hypothetical protein n=1 Tax=Massilia aurea TaxID=373040 RepID=UPI000F2DE411|nr:hypothetical protein [Massilia aurea]